LAHRQLRPRTGKIGKGIGKKGLVPNPGDCDVVGNMKCATDLPEEPVPDRDCGLCPLNRVRAGVEVRIKQLCASPQVAARLREIGFGEEQIVRLITSQANIICQVCNARLAISAQLARAILVQPLALQPAR
jgi:Fe2+ transport system protein FeoA